MLDNAFEAYPEGQILLKLEQQKKWFFLTIEDNGPGINPIVLKRKSEPFVTTKKKGVGLGLYTSELFAQSLGGYLLLKNKIEKKGALVTLLWPLEEKEL